MHLVLSKGVKATSSFFTCLGETANGIYQIEEEVVALVCAPELRVGDGATFYAFRAQQGTSAVAHEAGTPLRLIRVGEML